MPRARWTGPSPSRDAEASAASRSPAPITGCVAVGTAGKPPKRASSASAGLTRLLTRLITRERSARRQQSVDPRRAAHRRPHRSGPSRNLVWTPRCDRKCRTGGPLAAGSANLVCYLLTLCTLGSNIPAFQTSKPCRGSMNLDHNNAAPNTPLPRRLKRHLWRGLLVLLVLVAAAAVLGACYQFFENNADARRFPQKGKSVSLGPAFGNLTLNLDCDGEGSPTVILDSGLGVPAVGWNHVQAETAKFTRVCSYDRAGYGWSGVTTAPRTSAQIVKELHTL